DIWAAIRIRPIQAETVRCNGLGVAKAGDFAIMSRPSASLAMRLLAAAVIIAGTSAVASAKCTKLSFSVNDYGKDGPTRDAKALLDKSIATWTAERGIKKYTKGKKDVTCELFLDFGFFDEHTCTATAS